MGQMIEKDEPNCEQRAKNESNHKYKQTETKEKKMESENVEENELNSEWNRKSFDSVYST